MAYSTGMNVGEVRNLAGKLDQQANQINNDVIGQINSTLASLEANWSGADFQKFKGWWESEHRPQLQKLAQNIAGLAQSARNNAEEQEKISS